MVNAGVRLPEALAVVDDELLELGELVKGARRAVRRLQGLPTE